MILQQIELEYIDIAPYLGNEFKAKIELCCSWMSSELKIPLKGRVPEYIKKINDYPKYRGNFSDEMYYCLQSFFEMNQIVSLKNYFSDEKTKEFLDTIKKAVYGGAFRNQIRSADKDTARNYLFELSTASALKKMGMDVDLSNRADITIDSLRTVIECKRVHSEKKIITRVKDAVEQSKKDVSDDGSLFIFVDITGVFDSSMAIVAVNETGFPYSVSPPMNEDQLGALFKEKMEGIVKGSIRSCASKLNGLCQGRVSGIVLNYNSIGFHVNIVQERLVIGNLKYLIFNNDRSYKEMLEGYFEKYSEAKI